jgi:hypothetical protein
VDDELERLGEGSSRLTLERLRGKDVLGRHGCAAILYPLVDLIPRSRIHGASASRKDGRFTSSLCRHAEP